MLPLRLEFFAALLGAVLTISSASAAEITTLAEGIVNGVSTADRQGPANSGVLASLAEFGDPDARLFLFGSPAQAVATAEANGLSAVEVEGIFLYSGGAVSELRAVSTWSGWVTNSGHTPLPVSLDIRIAPAVLLLGDYSHQNLMTARYEIAIAANGAVVFASAAELSGSLAGHTLTKSGTDFGETYYVDGDFPHFGYLFDRFEQTLALGDVAPGDSLTVDWSMKVEGIASGDATGALARIGWAFGRRDYLSSVAIIPEPGTVCLLALGLVGLALRHRRRI